MKVYFSGSVKGKKFYEQQYREIVKVLEQLGHEVIYKYLFKTSINKIESQTVEQHLNIHKQLAQWKQEANVIVMEASYRSFGQGQELANALRIGKPVLALYLPGKKPHLIINEAGDRLLIMEYTLATIKTVLTEALAYLNVDEMKRFTMLLPSHLVSYLDTVAREKKINRSDYIRRLLEKDRLQC